MPSIYPELKKEKFGLEFYFLHTLQLLKAVHDIGDKDFSIETEYYK